MTAPEVVTGPRRYYLLKAYAADSLGDEELALTWIGKQRAITGTELAAAFPHRAALVAADYTTTEDLNGATVAELATNAGLTHTQATAALAAL